MKKYYLVLGLPENATRDAIKAAYRTLSKQYHPDANGSDISNGAKFIEINEAYTILIGNVTNSICDDMVDSVKNDSIHLKLENSRRNIEEMIFEHKCKIEFLLVKNFTLSCYMLFTSCIKELKIITDIVGCDDKYYIDTSTFVVEYLTISLIDFCKIPTVKDVLVVSQKGLKFGAKNVLGEVGFVLAEISRLRTSEKCKEWFNEQNLDLIIYAVDLKKKEVNKKQKEGCFIATMAYGNYNHPQVIILRRYRDARLQKSILGRMFIKFYYAVSPKVVSLSRDKEYVKMVARYLLNYFISKMKSDIR